MFRTQFRFLLKSAAAFDNGDQDEYLRMATAIRVLVHDTGSSTSLLGQWKRKNLRVETQSENASTILPQPGISGAGHCVLAITRLGDGSASVMPWAWAPERVRRRVNLAEWWEEPCGWCADGALFSRKDLVLAACNQDGGAHVDPTLNEIYFRLSRENGLGWYFGHDDPMPNPVPVWVRQVAHELLLTFQVYRQRLRLEPFDVPAREPGAPPLWSVRSEDDTPRLSDKYKIDFSQIRP